MLSVDVFVNFGENKIDLDVWDVDCLSLVTNIFP